ncbi:hypothetical protein B9Z55_003482 [Caenorhabditis nigoni]|uniref:Uncharacterized protein n=2 Tax=Caenorhabditis nigoni TaxID=1611254 RepID=A0A2G5VQW1_9PELO|nr:hypothetical protein B9Z55_003482 [Caenorhabditis nigoni]
MCNSKARGHREISRFQLAQRLPKISLAEKAVPLYISALSIYESSFQLNDTIYQFGVIRQAREGPNPETIEMQNLEGGCPQDIDRFGFRKRSLPDQTRQDVFDLECRKARLMITHRQLIALERERMELKNVPENLEEEDLVDPHQLDIRIRNQGPNSRDERLEGLNESIRYLKLGLEIEELDVQCYQCKRDNRPSPFDMFIQLTKTSPDGTDYIERFNYDKSLKEARKYLICKLFENRQLVTKIKSLRFWGLPHDEIVSSRPEGIKFDVQEFTTSGNLSEVLPRVETILEHPNRPFTSLSLNEWKLEDAQNPKVRSAEVLVLNNNNIRFADCVALCREVPNKKIKINSDLYIHPDQFGLLVENLIDTKGTLGTYHEITRIREEDEARDALRFIAERFENAVVGERLVTIPLPSELQLVVSYEPYQFNSSILMYTIKMEVVQSQNNLK